MQVSEVTALLLPMFREMLNSPTSSGRCGWRSCRSTTGKGRPSRRRPHRAQQRDRTMAHHEGTRLVRRPSASMRGPSISSAPSRAISRTSSLRAASVGGSSGARATCPDPVRASRVSPDACSSAVAGGHLSELRCGGVEVGRAARRWALAAAMASTAKRTEMPTGWPDQRAVRQDDDCSAIGHRPSRCAVTDRDEWAQSGQSAVTCSAARRMSAAGRVTRCSGKWSAGHCTTSSSGPSGGSGCSQSASVYRYDDAPPPPPPPCRINTAPVCSLSRPSEYPSVTCCPSARTAPYRSRARRSSSEA